MINLVIAKNMFEMDDLCQIRLQNGCKILQCFAHLWQRVTTIDAKIHLFWMLLVTTIVLFYSFVGLTVILNCGKI